jgi:hypothetical protein
MYIVLQTLHSYWAYLTLLTLILAALNALFGFFGAKNFTLGKDLRISLFALIFSHIQFLLGGILYFVSPRFSLWNELKMNEIMTNPLARLYLVEHPTINILAIALITIGWSKHKKEENSRRKFGKISFFYTLALILILSRIPWDIWLG